MFLLVELSRPRVLQSPLVLVRFEQPLPVQPQVLESRFPAQHLPVLELAFRPVVQLEQPVPAELVGLAVRVSLRLE